MIWLIAGGLVFLGLAWVGRKARLNTWRPGPWIHQFRTVRSVFSLCLMAVGLLMLVRGLWWEGLAALVLAALLGGSVRFRAGVKASAPEPAASYSPEEIRAYNRLNLAVGADRKAIVAAWKDLMKKAHPDQGGSVARASALNAARDVLLKRKR